MISYIICGFICFLIGLATGLIDVEDRESEAYRRGLRDGSNETRKMLYGDRRLP